MTDVDDILRRARLVALDVDGVMTDGRVVYAGQGATMLELQFFDVQDGLAIRWLVKAGIKVVWITGRGCDVTTHRAKELGIDAVVSDVGAKSEALTALQSRFGVAPEETVAMGDDLPDLGLRARSAVFVAPPNARDEVRAVADFVTSARGGSGAVRELVERILRAQGRWEALVDSYAR